MRRELGLVLWLAVSGLMLGSTRAAETVIEGWGTVINPSGDCNIRAERQKLSLKVPSGLHDLWKGQKDASQRFNAPRVMQSIEGDFLVQVKVTTQSRPGNGVADIPGLQQLTGIPGTHPYQGMGLLVWENEQHYLRVERGSIIHRDGTSLTIPWYVRGGSRVNDVKLTKAAQFQGPSTWLKLERSGQEFTSSLSHDGKKWIELGKLETQLPARVQVGISAVNVSQQPLAVEYENFKLLK